MQQARCKKIMEAKTRPNQTTNKDKFLGVLMIRTSCHIVVRSFVSEHSKIKIDMYLFQQQMLADHQSSSLKIKEKNKNSHTDILMQRVRYKHLQRFSDA